MTEAYIYSVRELLAELGKGREMFHLLNERIGAREWWLSGLEKPNRIPPYVARAAIKRSCVVPDQKGHYVLPGESAGDGVQQGLSK